MRLSPALPLLLLVATSCGVDQDFGAKTPAPTPSSPGPNGAAATPAELGLEVPLSTPQLVPDDVLAAGGAFDGSVYLLVWRGTRGMLGARLDPTAKVLDPTPFVIAPVPEAGDGEPAPPHVFARPGPEGGFRVLWSSPGSPTDDTAPAGLRGVWVERDGTVREVVRMIGSPATMSLVRKLVELDAGAGTYRAVIETNDDEIVVQDLSFPSAGQLWTGVECDPISLPGLVAGTATLGLAGTRTIVGGIVTDGADFAVSLGEVPQTATCGNENPPYRYTEILRAPFTAPYATCAARRPLELVVVNGGAVAVWAGGAETTPVPGWNGIIELRAASVPSTGGAGAPVLLASSSPSDICQPFPALGVAAHDDDVLVPTFFSTSSAPAPAPAPAAALHLDPTTMQTVEVGEGHLDVSRGSWSIAGPGGDYLSLVLSHGASAVVKTSGSERVPVAWPGAASTMKSAAGALDPVPGELTGIADTQVACQGESCFVLWNDTGAPPPSVVTRVSRVVAGQASGAPFTVLAPESGAKTTTGEVALAAGPNGALVIGVSGCDTLVQPIAATGPGAVRDLVPDDHCPNGDAHLAAITAIASGTEYFGVAISQGLSEPYPVVPPMATIMRLDPDGALLESRRLTQPFLPADGMPFAIAGVAGAAGRIVAIAWPGSPILDMALPSSPPWATSFAAGSLDPSPIVHLPAELAGALTMAVTPTGSGDGFRLVWLVAPDPTVAKFELRALSLDPSGNVTTPPRTLLTDDGIAGQLRARADVEGISVGYAHQAFATDPAELVFVRFDEAGQLLGPVSTIARNLPPTAREMIGNHLGGYFSGDFAPTTPGSWFTAYARPTPSASLSTTLFGRTIHGASAAVLATK